MAKYNLWQRFRRGQRRRAIKRFKDFHRDKYVIRWRDSSTDYWYWFAGWYWEGEERWVSNDRNVKIRDFHVFHGHNGVIPEGIRLYDNEKDVITDFNMIDEHKGRKADILKLTDEWLDDQLTLKKITLKEDR